jgi:hypothetical protein
LDWTLLTGATEVARGQLAQKPRTSTVIFVKMTLKLSTFEKPSGQILGLIVMSH